MSSGITMVGCVSFDLDHRVVRQVVQIASFRRTFVKDELCARAYHHILLIDAQKSSLLVAVVRIKEECQVLLNVFFVEINSVFHDRLVNRVNVEEMELICLIVVSCHFNVIHSRIDIKSFKLHRIYRVGLLEP